MGSSCVCPSNPPSLTPRHRGKENQLRPRQQHKDIKFADINPIQMIDLEESQIELKLLNNQIVGYLNEFQQDNGVISKRFTLQLQGSSFRNPGVMSFTSQNKSLQKIQDPKILGGQQLNIPIDANEDIDGNSHGISQSFYSEAELQDKKQSCLLSQQSHILESSLFTDRIQVKNHFYQKYSKMQDFELQNWNQQNRRSFSISDQQFNWIKKNQTYPQKLLVLMNQIRNYHFSHQLHLLAYSLSPMGFKVHFNGKKRLFPLQQCNSQPSLDHIMDVLSKLIGSYQIGEIAYYLTGWIPEELKMSEIRSFQGIFQRLKSNMEQGNILAFFSRQQNNMLQYASLTRIDLQNGSITVNICNSQSTLPQELLIKSLTSEGELTMKIEDFIILFDTINLSWNPIIYQSSISRYCTIMNQLSTIKYKLVIPPSSQDIEIRIFCEKHHNCQKESSSSSLIAKLFQYENMGNVAESVPVRTVEINQNVLSDVFIFESCKEKTQYLLTVQTESSRGQEIYSTITLLSFVQIYFNEVNNNILLAGTALQTKITPKNKGYGVNSPYFSENLHFLIESEVNKELQINVDVSSALSYEICCIPNPEKKETLTKLNMQNIINNSILSNEKHGSGSFNITTSCQHYIIMINSYSDYQGEIKINLSLYGKKQDKNAILTIKEIEVHNKVIFVQGVKWLPSNFGPRKRLKSNSNNNYQPADIFADFFKNPIIDHQLTKGKYQFFLKSESFKEYFDEVDDIEKNQCEPPALSMSVLKISDNHSEYQIIIDDAFYVPFGIGFWTSEIELEDGEYRFVLPKMDKTFAKGTFGIVQC